MNAIVEHLVDREAKILEPTQTQIDALHDLKSILRFASREKDVSAPDERRVNDGLTDGDLSQALALVKCAAEFIEKSDQRAREVENKARMLVQLATDEMKQAIDEASEIQKRLDFAETRLLETEQRLQEAIDWNVRFYDTITATFSAFARPRGHK
jgi:DNA repair ATPase RecN